MGIRLYPSDRGGVSLESTGNNESQPCPAASPGTQARQGERVAVDRVGGLWVWIQIDARDNKQQED